MDQNKRAIYMKKIERTMENLRKNHMEAYFAEDCAACVRQVEQLLHPGDTVAAGGSMSLAESGVLDLLRGGSYRFLDRSRSGITKEEVEQVHRETFGADAFLCSSNAITENGELYNVDGFSNRVSALLFGPKSVIVVAGYNKIVRDMDEAILRLKWVAAPANCVRLGFDTPCRQAGQCVSLSAGKGSDMTAGCASDARICCSYVVCAAQRVHGRIKVVLVGEELGY